MYYITILIIYIDYFQIDYKSYARMRYQFADILLLHN